MHKNTCCQICVKEFFKASNLNRHIKKFHPETFKPPPKKQFNFTCEVCGKNFSYIRNYRSHTRTHDPNTPSTKITKKCPLCIFVSEKTEMYHHFKKSHDIRLVTEKLEFANFDSFMKWKMSSESDNRITFVRSYTQQTKYYDEVILYVCHRSGHYSHKVKSMNKTKDISTKKIGGFCPASIKMMKKNDGSVLVSFLQTHVGHSDKTEKPEGESDKKLKNILLRHKNSCNLPKDSSVRSENVWQFQSENKNEIYVISVNDSQCTFKCPFTCRDCKACIHKYSCSCKDWTVKWNMCVHIHSSCRSLNEEQEEKPGPVPQNSNSSSDISDSIVYDGANGGEREIHEIRPAIPVEEKNLILQEFSDILFKCNSPSSFQEIVTIVEGSKARVECEEILTPTQNYISR